jgi:hypothetical protein
MFDVGCAQSLLGMPNDNFDVSGRHRRNLSSFAAPA